MLPLSLVLLGSAQASGPHWKPIDAAIDSYDRGVVALDAARLEPAARRLREALDHDPDCGACLHALGVTLLRQDDAEEAVEILQDLAHRHPERAEVMVSLADAAFGSQDFGLSIEAAGIALVLDATRWEALTAMVRACLRTGDVATARRWMESASGAHPDDRLACLEADLLVEEAALDDAVKAMEKCSLSGDADLIGHARARIAAATGDYTGLSSQARQRGDKALGRVSEAFAAHEAGEHRRATILLRQELAANPANAEAALLLGLSEHALGHSARAEQALGQAFVGETWIQVGSDGSYRGVVTAEGERIFDERLRQGVGLLIQLQVQRGDLEGAARSLDRAKEELATCAEVDAGRIALLAARGEPEAAAICATRAVAAWPGVPMLDDAVRDLLLSHPSSRSPQLLEAAAAAGLVEGHYWAAIAQRDTGAPLACIDTLAPALDALDSPSRHTVLTLAWACAVEADELERADGYRTVLGATGADLDADVSLNHARLLLASGRFEDCIGLLGGLGLERADRVDYARGLGLMAHIGLGDLDTATAQAATGPVSPETRFELALALLREERIDEATPLLEGCCATLAVEEHQARCSAILEQVRGLEAEAR
jgi:tetratricopeptide (TPR) repeat protein